MVCFTTYLDRSKQAGGRREAFVEPPCQVHYGDDPRELETQYQSSHSLKGRLPVGPNTNSKWPKMPSAHVVRGEEIYREEPRHRHRVSNNYTPIQEDLRGGRGRQNPLKGYYEDKPKHDAQTSREMVQQMNKVVPPLRSLGGVRPWNVNDEPKYYEK